MNLKTSYTNYFPLSFHNRTSSKAEFTYFDAAQTYQLVNEAHHIIGEVNGAEILEYFNLQYEQRRRQAEEERQRRKEEQEYYSNLNFISSTTKTPYKVQLWDKNGRKRSTIELIIILAVVTIHNENGKWESSSSSVEHQELKRHPIYAKKDWKIQNMLDTIKVAREEKIENLNGLEERLNIAGKNVSKAKAELRRLTAVRNKMEILYEAIEGYKEVKEICEQLQTMPDGEKKTGLQQQYANEIEDYKKYKSVMYRHKVSTDEEILDFLERYQVIQDKLPKVEKETEKCKEEYRRLSRLSYNLQLAQNIQYCYGPNFLELELEELQQNENRNSQSRERS